MRKGDHIMRNQSTQREKAIRNTRWTRRIAWVLVLTLCLSCCAAHAETPEFPKPIDGVSPEDVDWSVVEEENTSNVPALILDEFAADDIPETYLTEAERQGRVEKIYYFTSDSATGGNETVKSVMVYYPAGYDDSDQPYNILYLLHGANGSPLGYRSERRIIESRLIRGKEVKHHAENAFVILDCADAAVRRASCLGRGNIFC